MAADASRAGVRQGGAAAVPLVLVASPLLVAMLLCPALGPSVAGARQVAAQTPAAAGPVSDAARRSAERLRTLQRQADALAVEQRTLVGDLRTLEVERQIAVERRAQIERDRADTAGALEAAETRAAVLAQTAAVQLPDVEARLVQLYKLGRAGYWRLLLNASDLDSLGRAYRAASVINAVDRAMVNAHYATLDALARERAALQRRAATLAALDADATRSRAAIDRAVAARTALVDGIDARRDLTARLIGELQTAQDRLQSSIAELEPGAAAATILPIRAFQGDLPWPARGPVARRFGRQPASQDADAVVRSGMDIGVPEGTPIRSVHEGVVAYADAFSGYGNLVILEHGSRAHSLYGYLDEIAVTRGQRVEAQGAIGTAGRAPGGTPGLYFELRIDGAAVDPVQWLRR